MWCLAIVLFFSKEVLGKRWGLSTSCGASLWVECDVVSSFSKILLKQQFASSFYLVITSYLPLHSLCYSLKATFILSEGIKLVSCIRIEFEKRRLSLFEEPGKHDCIVGATMKELNPSELQKENDFLQQFSSNLFIIILIMLFLFWGRLVVPRNKCTRVPFNYISCPSYWPKV
jgi:hypothetical protein